MNMPLPPQALRPAVEIAVSRAGEVTAGAHAFDTSLADSLPSARSVLALACDVPALRERYLRRYPQARWHEAVDLAQAEAAGTRFDLILVGPRLGQGPLAGHAPDLLFDALAKLSEAKAELIMRVTNAATLDMLERVIEGDLSCVDPRADGRAHSASSIFKQLMNAGWMPRLATKRLATAARQATEAAALAMADVLAIPRPTVTRRLSMDELVIRARREFDDHPPVPAVGLRAPFTVVVPTTRDRQLRLNVQASPGLAEVGARIVSCRHAADPAEALAAALEHCDSDWVLLCHQDVYFARGFGERLAEVLAAIAPEEQERTLIGFVGMGVNEASHAFEPAGFVIDRLEAANYPPSNRAMSIDELAIVVSRHSLHRIDPALGWHLWATDLCLAAICQHRVFARILRLPLFHNSVTDYELPQAFRRSAAVLAAKYPDFQSIPTLCGTIDAEFLGDRSGELHVAPGAVAATPTPAPASPPASLSVDLPAAQAQVGALIGAGRLDDALLAMAQAVHETYLRPGVAHNALYYPDFDRCIEALSVRLATHLPASAPVDAGRHVIVATELYALGGHSKVIEDLSHEVDAPVLLLTDLFGRVHKSPAQMDWLRERFAHASVVVVPPMPLWQKCLWLGTLVRTLGPASISYLAHHQDPVAYVATLTQPGARKLFFHHADHNPALGCTLEGVRHVDLSPALQSLCGSGLAESPTLLPMHVADQGAKRFTKCRDRHFSVVTSGHPAKFTRSGPVALQAIVRATLGAIDGKFFHIGPLDDEWVGELRATLAAAGLDPARFMPLGQVPSLWTTLREIDAAFYIGSAPVAGGRGSIEAQGCGLPVLFFDGFDTGPLVENFSLFADRSLGWGSVDALAELLGRVGARHKALSREARAFYARGYSHASFRRALVDLIGA